MIDDTNIHHGTIVDYLTGKTDVETQAQIKAACSADPAYELLFSIIDDLKVRVNPDQLQQVETTNVSSAKIDRYVENLLAGPVHPEDETDQNFANLLISSPAFYGRLLARLQSISPCMDEQDAPELSNGTIQMKSASDVLDMINVATGQVATTPVVEPPVEPVRTRPEHKTSIWQEIFDRIADLFEPIPNYAYAATVITLLIVASPFILQNLQSNAFEDYANNWETSTPHAYTDSGLKSGGVGTLRSDGTTDVAEALSRIKLIVAAAMGSYQTQDYSDAVSELSLHNELVMEIYNNLDGIEADTAPIDQQLIPELKRELKDYFFYLGSAQLASSRHDRGEQSADMLNNSAIENLTTALSIVASDEEKTSGREDFHLGIALGLRGDTEAAYDRLKAVQASSGYYDHAQKLLGEAN